jgi:multidrug efflux system outer membrane protein
MKSISSLACLIFLLTSCLRPHYTPPPVDVPEQWRFEADEASTLCNLRWWEELHDPVLNELIIQALNNNQDLQVAINRVFEYYERLGVVNAALYPAINGNGFYSRTKNSIASPLAAPAALRILNNFQLYFSLSWELDFWGRIQSASEAAYAELLGQVEARRAVVVTVVSSVANGYITLRQLDSQLQVSLNTLQAMLEALKIAEHRFALGETSEMEVKQAESEVEVAAIRVIEFEREIPIQEDLLSILLGENPGPIMRGRPIEAFDYPPLIPAGLPADLLARRPDIMQAEYNLIAANARVSEARALFFPQFTLTGLYGSQSSSLKRFLTSPAETWQYGLSAVEPIFDANRVSYLVGTAEAIREEAYYSYFQTILNGFSEVNSGLVRYAKNRELVLEHQKQIEVLVDYLHFAQLRYSEGEIDYLNVLDAERSLFNAQLQLVQAQGDSFTALVNLYSALGGGWICDADMIATEREGEE